MEEKLREELKLVAGALRDLSSAVVLSHYNPDADAYGSLCAMSLALKALGKKIYPLNESPLDKKFAAVPFISEVNSTFPAAGFDTVVALDCGDIARVGDSLKGELAKFRVINIDHHSSNTRFGAVNFVADKASSTCEMVYDLIRELKVPISKEIATCLLLGIVGDTGSFRYPSTSAKTFEIAAELVRAGAKPSEISGWQFENRPMAGVKLNAFITSNAEFLCDGQIALASAPSEVYTRFGASVNDTEGLVEELRSIQGVKISAFLRQDGEIWRVSLRSKDQKIDLSAVAAEFGGGGHKAAAAFRSKRELSEIKSKLIPLLESELHKN